MAVSHASLWNVRSISGRRSFSDARSRIPIGSFSFQSSSSSFVSASLSLSPNLHLQRPVGRRMKSWSLSVRAMDPIWEPEVTKKVYMDIKIREAASGRNGAGARIEIGLYGSVVPEIVKNFTALCTGEKGVSYRGSAGFYRVEKDRFIHGGIINGKLKDAVTKFTCLPPPDEESLPPPTYGVIAMKNIDDCPDYTYGNEFFIVTTKEENPSVPILRDIDIVFGRVSEGSMDGLMKLIESVAVESQTGIDPSKRLVIINCGEL